MMYKISFGMEIFFVNILYVFNYLDDSLKKFK